MLLDQAGEARLGKLQIGTTRRGIGPATPTRRPGWASACRTCSTRRSSRRRSSPRWSPSGCRCGRSRRRPELDLQSMTEEYLTYGHRIEQYIADTARLVWDVLDARRRRDLRGCAGHAARHRPRHVSVRDVARTRSPASACTGTGVGPKDIDEVLGRRQGLRDARRRRARSRPSSTTSSARPIRERRRRVRHDDRPPAPRRLDRPRRAALRGAHQLAHRTSRSRSSTCSTGLGELKVCTRYRGADERDSTTSPTTRPSCTTRPASTSELPGLGRGHRASAARRPSCPQAARDYLAFIADFVGVPVALIGVGPGREQMIWTGAGRDVGGRPRGCAGL